MENVIVKHAGRKPREEFVPTTLLISELQAGKTAKQVAAQHGLTTAAVYNRCKKAGFSVVAVRSYKERRADLFAWKAQQIVEAMTPEKISGASLRDQATTLNIIGNMERLERGQATANINLAQIGLELNDLELEEIRLRNLLLNPGGPVLSSAEAATTPPTDASPEPDPDEI